MTFDPRQPFNDLPLLPPERKFIETISVLKKLPGARAALAELKGMCSQIPNPKILLNTLVIREAKASSEIENIFTTDDELYKAISSKHESDDPAIREVINYREAAWTSFQKLQNQKKFDTDLLEMIYRKIKNEQDSFRQKNVRIANENTGETIYTPPDFGKILDRKIDNWIEYANINDDLDPLIKTALLHYQFEAIHPFRDGNGRTGRILNILFLIKKSLLTLPILYLSRYINRNRQRYYELLLDVSQNNNWEEWILYFLKAITFTSIFTLNKIVAIKLHLEKTRNLIAEKLPSIYKYELIELLFSQPYVTQSMIINAGIVNARQTAANYLTELVQLGILEKQKNGKENLYKNIDLYDLLSDN